MWGLLVYPCTIPENLSFHKQKIKLAKLHVPDQCDRLSRCSTALFDRFIRQRLPRLIVCTYPSVTQLHDYTS
jgi:hypothetical protein